MTQNKWMVNLALTLFWSIGILASEIFFDGDINVFDIIFAVVGGLFFTLGFSVLTRVSGKWLRKINIDTEPGELVLMDGGANHFVGLEAVGGKLFLTSHRLVFKSHRYNIQCHEQSIEINTIRKIEVFKSLGVLANGLQIELLSGQVHKFIVDDPAQWKKAFDGRLPYIADNI